MGARDIRLQQIIKCVEKTKTRLRLILLQTIIITFVFAKVSQPARIKQEKCQILKRKKLRKNKLLFFLFAHYKSQAT